MELTGDKGALGPQCLCVGSLHHKGAPVRGLQDHAQNYCYDKKNYGRQPVWTCGIIAIEKMKCDLAKAACYNDRNTPEA